MLLMLIFRCLSIMSSKSRTKSVALGSKYHLRRGPGDDTNDMSATDKSNTEMKVTDSRITSPKSSRGKKRKVIVEAEEENVSTAEVKSTSKSAPGLSQGEEKWFPANWEQALNNIRNMRKDVEAPVDVMGCDMCHDKTSSPIIQRYQILVSLMLSSQTKDQVTFAAMGRLREHGLTPENIVNTNDAVLNELIKPVGFYKRKTEFIKRASEILLNQYNGDIPNSVDDLCKLPGVGPKMAHICMKVAWDVVSGIGVDTHVHRISQRIGWIPGPKKKNLTPEDVRKGLESWLPQDLWSEVNHLLVGFGQTVCKPTSPSCSNCLNSSFCPSAKLKW